MNFDIDDVSPVGTEPVVEDAPIVDDPVVSIEETPTETPPSIEDAPDADPASADAPELSTEEALRKQIEELQGSLAAVQTPQTPQTPENTFDVSSVKLPAVGEVTTVDFLQDREPADIFESKESFNQFCNSLLTAAIQTANNTTYDRIMTNLPSAVSTTAKQQLDVHRIVDDFYSNNADLAPYKNTVSKAVLQISSEKPTISVQEALKEAGERCRASLRLSAAPRTPATPIRGGGGVQRVNPVVDTVGKTQQDQMMDLLNARR